MPTKCLCTYRFKLLPKSAGIIMKCEEARACARAQKLFLATMTQNSHSGDFASKLSSQCSSINTHSPLCISVPSRVACKHSFLCTHDLYCFLLLLSWWSHRVDFNHIRKTRCRCHLQSKLWSFRVDLIMKECTNIRFIYLESIPTDWSTSHLSWEDMHW